MKQKEQMAFSTSHLWQKCTEVYQGTTLEFRGTNNS